MEEEIEVLDECSNCGTILSYEWEVDVCKDCLKANAKSATIAKMDPLPPTITFVGKDNLEILRLEPNGDIFVKGKLVENDKQVTEALKQFLVSHGWL